MSGEEPDPASQGAKPGSDAGGARREEAGQAHTGQLRDSGTGTNDEPADAERIDLEVPRSSAEPAHSEDAQSDGAPEESNRDAEPIAAASPPGPAELASSERSKQPSAGAASIARHWLERWRALRKSRVAESLPLDPEQVVSEAQRSPWGIAARSLTLGLLLGISLVAWAQFSFDADWVVDFLIKNSLPLDKRMSLIYSMLSGGVVGVLVVAGAVGWSIKQRRTLEPVERWLWFLSPLTLAPTLPLLLRYRIWEDSHENLLPALLFVGLVLELFLFKCFRSVPPSVRSAWDATRADLPAFVRRHGPLIVVVCAALAYTVFMSFYTIRWHHKLGTGNYDLGINNNLLYGGLYGDFNHSRIVFPEDPAKYIANHVKIGAYVFLPIYALVPRPETLQVIQSAALGFGALPLFLFARRHVSAWMAAVIALGWLSYYPMHGANFYEVKWVPVASFFVLLTVWAADARRWVILGFAFVIGMLLREDMPVGFAVIGTFLLLSGHRPIPGLIMAVVASSWFVALRFYIMDSAGEWWFPKMYKDLWADGEAGFRSVVKTLVSNPFFTLQHVLIEKKIIYLMHLLVPLLFLPARRWYLWAAFLPGAMLTLLVTDYKPVTMYSFQYVMHWAPYMFLAVPLALAAYQRENAGGKCRALATLGAVAFTIGVLSYNYGAFPARDRALKSGYHSITFSMSDEERTRYAELRDIISSIPPDASVAATEKIGPHVSSRRVFYSLRRDSYHADFLIARPKGLRLDRTKRVITDALTSGEYGVFRRVGEFVLMKRGHSTADNDAVIDEWRLKRPVRRDLDQDEPEQAIEPGTMPDPGGPGEEAPETELD